VYRRDVMADSGDQPTQPQPEPPVDEESPGRVARVKARAEEAKRAGLERLERERARRTSVQIAMDTYNRDRRFAGGLLAGGLAFRLFLWLLPLALVVVTAFGELADRSNQSPSDVARDSGFSAALAASVAQGVAASKQGRLYLLALGIFLLVWAGMGVLKAARLISGLAWEMQPTMARNLPMTSTLFCLATIAVLAFQRVVYALLGGPLVTDVIVIVGEAILLIALGAWVFWHLPHAADARWLDMLPGATLLGLGLLGTRLVTIFYFSGRLDRVDDLYGALGVASVFLAWLFIIARLWVAAVGLNASTYRSSRRSEVSG
jgi:uncharacterized BrkB/YihY/UPF0761 family membrane protein